MGFRLTNEPSEAGQRLRGGSSKAAVSPGARRAVLRRRVRQRTIAIMPTLLTLANLLCGFVAVFIASRPFDATLPFGWTPLTFAALFVFLGLMFDALDGRVARMTRNTSDMGAQLDSMADMVAFGVAPAFMLVQIVKVQAPFPTDAGDTTFDRLGLVIACIYVACAGLRLARYNVELGGRRAGRTLFFSGLPSPGAAGTVAGLCLLHQHLWAGSPGGPYSDAAAYGMLAVSMLCALAMISRLPYVHLMNRYVRGRAAFGSVAVSVIVLLLLLVWPQPAIAGGFVAYALSAPLAWLVGRRQLIND